MTSSLRNRMARLSIAMAMIAFTMTPAAIAQASQEGHSPGLIIAQVQTGGSGAGTAAEEFILIYNSSPQDVSVTNWCVSYASAADNLGFKACAQSVHESTDLLLEQGRFMSFATDEFTAAHADFTPDFTMAGGISGASGHIRLLDADNAVQDKVGWGEAISPEGVASEAHKSGEVLSRDVTKELPDTDSNSEDFSSQPIKQMITSGLYEQEIIVDVCANITEVQAVVPEGFLVDELGDCYIDLCPNIEGLQIAIPIEYEKIADSDECTRIPLEDAALSITELLPNAPGSDASQEFIELHNPNGNLVSLVGYKIQVGPGFTKEFIFGDGNIASNEYKIFSDLVTNIVLPNTSGIQLRLISPAGNTVSESAVYAGAADDESWALVDGKWVFTNQITPGATNKPFFEPVTSKAARASVVSVLAPCPTGKLRNPATNRCKSIETAVSQLIPCDADEFRNPSTNRCNKVSSSSVSDLTPCAENQERNPNTNRCRKVSILAANDAQQPLVEDVLIRNTQGQINWGVISVSILGTFGYMIYEWRIELQRKLYMFKRV